MEVLMKKISYVLFILGFLKAFPSMAIDGFVKTDLGWEAKKFISPYVNNPKVYKIKDDRLCLKLPNGNLEEIAKFTDEISVACYEYVAIFLKNKYSSLLNFKSSPKGMSSNFIELFINEFMEKVEEPQKDDIVTYFYYGYVGTGNSEFCLNHVAVMVAPDMVRAKWGQGLYGKVLEHKLEIVVQGYGPYLKFYRLKNEFKDIDTYKKCFEEEMSRFLNPLYEQLFFKFSILDTLTSFYEKHAHQSSQETINKIKSDLLNVKKEINCIVNDYIDQDEKKVKFISQSSLAVPISKIHHEIIHDITSNWLDTKNKSEIHDFVAAFLLKIIGKSFNCKQIPSFIIDTDSMINEIIDTDGRINQINEKIET